MQTLKHTVTLTLVQTLTLPHIYKHISHTLTQTDTTHTNIPPTHKHTQTPHKYNVPHYQHKFDQKLNKLTQTQTSYDKLLVKKVL